PFATAHAKQSVTRQNCSCVCASLMRLEAGEFMSLCHQQRSRPAPWKSASVLVSLLLLNGCGRKENADVLATVGPRHIRAADLRAEVERRYQRQQPVPDKQTLLQEMIDREALLQRARAAGLDHDPQTARAIENLLLGQLTERDLTPRLDAV